MPLGETHYGITGNAHRPKLLALRMGRAIVEKINRLDGLVDLVLDIRCDPRRLHER